MIALLETVGLTRFFGSVRAAEDLNMRVEQGEVVGIIGSNGSGKTTFLNLATGYLKPERGRILLEGRDTTALPPRAITRLGVARSFQIPQLYLGMTVLETVLLSLAARAGRIGVWGPLKRSGWTDEGVQVLAQFGLDPHAGRLGGRAARRQPEAARHRAGGGVAAAPAPHG